MFSGSWSLRLLVGKLIVGASTLKTVGGLDFPVSKLNARKSATRINNTPEKRRM